MSTSLPDELNTFYARSENKFPTEELPSGPSTQALGPDGIPGRALKLCADQLVSVFTDIFTLSLPQSAVPPFLNKSLLSLSPKRPKPSAHLNVHTFQIDQQTTPLP